MRKTDNQAQSSWGLGQWLAAVFRLLGFRLVFLICLSGVALGVVGVDSSHNLASADDLGMHQPQWATVQFQSVLPSPHQWSTQPEHQQKPVIETSAEIHSNDQTPQGLSHASLMRTSLTHSRLTNAHLFTDFLAQGQ